LAQIITIFFLELPANSNAGFAVEIVVLSCLQAYILIVPVYVAPFWIFHFRLNLAGFPFISIGMAVVSNGGAVEMGSR
jgi:hypothetical protein